LRIEFVHSPNQIESISKWMSSPVGSECARIPRITHTKKTRSER